MWERTSIENDPLSGRLAIAFTEKNDQKVEAMIQGDRKCIYYDKEEYLNIGSANVTEILHTFSVSKNNSKSCKY